MLAFGLLLTMVTPEVHLDEPLPLSFLLSTPTGEVAATNTSEIIRMLDELFTEHTDLRPVLLDAVLLGECRGRLSCLSVKSRRDFEDTERLKREGVKYPRYLLLLSNVSSPDQPDRMSALLVDTDEALAIYESAERKAYWEDEVEERVVSNAVLAEVKRKEIADPEEARAFLIELVTVVLKRPLEEAGHYEPYGRIAVSCNVDGAAISVDGTTLGVIRGNLAIGRARPGTHSIEISHQDHLPFIETIAVARGEITEVDARLIAGGDLAIAGPIVFWTGIALSVAGVSVLTAALILEDRDLETGCWDPDCGGGSFRSLNGSTAEEALPEEVNPPGVLAAPLGYSLLGTGAAFTVGSLLEENAVPWISLIAGFAIGGIVYGLSAAFDGPHN